MRRLLTYECDGAFGSICTFCPIFRMSGPPPIASGIAIGTILFQGSIPNDVRNEFNFD